MIIDNAVLFTISAFAAAVLLFPVRYALKRIGVVDRPNSRSSHTVENVRGGGLVIVFVLAVVLTNILLKALETHAQEFAVTADAPLELAVALAGFVAVALISFCDDLTRLPPRYRLLTHATAAAAVVGVMLFAPPQKPFTAWIIPVGFLWVTGYTNAFNFMDGINGIAGMQAIVTGFGTAFVGVQLGLPPMHRAIVLAGCVAATTIGFFPHNFPKARVFMGDVGSAPLGFLLATLAFWVAEQTAWWVLFWIGLLHANFVLDTGITLIRRALNKERLQDAHRDHFYQRLVRAGRSHTFVTLTQAGLQVFIAIALWRAANATSGIKLGVATAVIAVWLTYFGLAEYEFRKSPAGCRDAVTDQRKSC